MKKKNWILVEIGISVIILFILLVLAGENPESPPNKYIMYGLLIWVGIKIKKYFKKEGKKTEEVIKRLKKN